MRCGYLLFLLCTSLNAAVIMQVDPPRIKPGETIRLTLTLNEVKDRVVPDLTSVRKDFNVIGTQRTVNYTVVNGQAQSLSQWIIILMPKRTGQLTIPSIPIGSDKTPEKMVMVADAPAGNTAGQSSGGSGIADSKEDAVLLKTEISDAHPYVNQEVIYSVKLYTCRRLLDADYEPPQIKNALMIPLGNADRSQVNKNGIEYMVETIQYAIFPQKSGSLTITPPRFSALLFDMVPGKVQREGKPLTLNVKAAVQGATKTPWLPAKQLELTEHYDKSAKTIEQGGMLTRTVTLKAVGVPAQLLPPFTWDSQDAFSVYPEKPVENTVYQHGDIVGAVTIKLSYLFNQSGHVEIPEVKLPWFNTATGQSQMVTLPAQTIMVKGQAKASGPAGLKASASEGTSVAKMSATMASPLKIRMHLARYQRVAWAWWVALGFALLWLLTLLAWWCSRRASGRGNKLSDARKRLRQACLANDAGAAKDALLAWGKQVWPDKSCMNLDDVAHGVTYEPLRRSIHQLSQRLYQKPNGSNVIPSHAQGRNDDLLNLMSDVKPIQGAIFQDEVHPMTQHETKQDDWQGNDLWRCFLAQPSDKKKVKKSATNPLPNLTP